VQALDEPPGAVRVIPAKMLLVGSTPEGAIRPQRTPIRHWSSHSAPFWDMLMGMQVSFNAQPSESGRDLRDFIAAVADDEALVDLEVVVAWAKRSGLDLVRASLDIIRAREGGSTRLIVGIDEGGATQEGLMLARELFEAVHVFHVDTWRTFHPKVYVARGDAVARVLVGSNNLTAGGVYYNYEAGLECVLDLSISEDHALLDQITRYIEQLRDDAAVCLPLDDDLYDELVRNPRYRVRQETVEKPPVPEEDPADLPDNVDAPGAPGAEDQLPPSVFGQSSTKKRHRPSVPAGVASPPITSIPAVPRPQSSPKRISRGTGGTVVKRWTKELTNSDAQQKLTANTQITGNLKLTQAGHPINHETYFRHDFFGPAAWASEPKPRGELETAEIDVEVLIDGTSVGVHRMVVDHADYRIADQSNVPTWLKWKEFGEHLQQHDQRDKTVSLERFADGTYRAHIAAVASGPFL